MTERPGTAVARAAGILADAGVPSPRADAELLAAHVLGVPRTAVATAEWSAQEAARFDGLVASRAERVPLQHLTGEAPFRHLILAVGPGVFVPRPETELVAGRAIAAATPGSTVVDLCSGSGAIGLSVAVESPGVCVHAVEVDPFAAAWGRRNAEALADRIAAAGSQYALHVGAVADAVAGPPALPAGSVDVVVANPPYIPADAVPVDPEVAEHDPEVALYGGDDGLDVVREVVAAAAALLRPGGLLLIEHGELQGAGVRALLPEWTDVRTERDLTGRPRWTEATR